MSQTKQVLPQPYDARVDAALAEPMPDDVVLAFFDVGRGKSPTLNSRWNLRRDGALFFVRHSGKIVDWKVPFDRPLPAQPALTLAPGQLAELTAALDATGFFTHPGHEVVQGAGGSYWIVRARKGAQLHTVVFENAKSPLLERLWKVAETL